MNSVLNLFRPIFDHFIKSCSPPRSTHVVLLWVNGSAQKQNQETIVTESDARVEITVTILAITVYIMHSKVLSKWCVINCMSCLVLDLGRP